MRECVFALFTVWVFFKSFSVSLLDCCILARSCSKRAVDAADARQKGKKKIIFVLVGYQHFY